MNTAISYIGFIRRLGQAVLALSLLGLASQVSAQTQVENAWVRATVAGQQATGAFMTLTASSDSKLLSVQSPIARIVQIHVSTMNNDVMSMHPVDFVPLPAGKAVALDPGSYHVMLIDLVEQIKAGDKVPLVLTVENAKGEKETLAIEAEVRALNAGS